MLLGLDLDNTIVCYEAVFRDAAVERGLVPPDTPASKRVVRDLLRESGREDAWTELQGYAYGPGMERARPFPGVAAFLTQARAHDCRVCVISHRTPTPIGGPSHDLWASARAWLARERLLDAGGTGASAFFETTRSAKLERIRATGCTHFIDDLPELLASADFPGGVTRVLFWPGPDAPHDVPFPVARSWAEAARLLFPTVAESRT
jgi:hypothetical protein